MPIGLRRTIVAASIAAIGFAATACAHDGQSSGDPQHRQLNHIKHIVVIYEENHSFDNLYGGWERVSGPGKHFVPQVDQAGAVLSCLLQDDVNLTSPPLATTCSDVGRGISGAFANRSFMIDTDIAAGDTTCPAPGVSAPNGVLKGAGLPGGCTRDLVHRYYQEQYQINGGKMDRYVTGSDAVGLSAGQYDTKQLPIYAYLHKHGHPDYVIADNFFQAAFGGSFLNHQWLVAAQTPEWTGAVNDGSAYDLHSVVDANGMPNNYPLYTSPAGTMVKDQALTASCSPAYNRLATPTGVACGDYAINTIQPEYWPYAPGTVIQKRLPALKTANIGDRMTAASIDWAWYSGGWANAEGDSAQPGFTNGTGPTCSDANAIAGSAWPKCPDKLFQFHHQAFNYFANYAPGTATRSQHLRDEAEFLQTVQTSTKHSCDLKSVSFIKPLGEENEHPGYASESQGSSHLVDLLQAIEGSACAKDTMVIVTYDEFGGYADHVAPPGPGNDKGPHDQWGPGTRVPTLVIAPGLNGRFGVDHTVHDTTSILATIERRFGLAPLGTRDANVNDLSTVFAAHPED
jgi:acid phosphatase